MKTYAELIESIKSPNPYHGEMINHGYEFKKKYPKLGQTGQTYHYVHKDTGHKAHVEKMGKDNYVLYGNDRKGRQLLVSHPSDLSKI